MSNLNESKLFGLLRNLKDLYRYDNIALSTDKSKVAFTIKHKLEDHHFRKEDFDANIYSGTEIWLIDLNSNETKIISKSNSWRPTWSHDSKKIAFFSDKNGTPQLWIYSINNNETILVSELKIKSGFSSHTKIVWSNDDSKVYYSTERTEIATVAVHVNSNLQIKHFVSPNDNSGCDYSSQIENHDSADIRETDINTGTSTTLIPNTHLSSPTCNIDISPSGDYLSYTSPIRFTEGSYYFYTSLWVLPLSKSNEPLLINDNLSISNDPNYKLPYLWLSKQNKIIFVKSGKLYLAAALDSEPNVKLIFNCEKYQLTTAIFQLSENNRKLIISAEKYENPHNIIAIFIIDLVNNQPAILIDINEYPEFSCIKNIFQPTTDEMVLITQEKTSAKTTAIIFDLKQTQYDEETGYRKISNFSYGEKNYYRFEHLTNIPVVNDNCILSWYQTPHQPLNLAMLDKKLHLKKILTHLNPPLDKLSPYTIEILTTNVITASGKKLNVKTSILFPSIKPRGAITCVYPSSRPSDSISSFGGTQNGVFPNWLYLENGYAVILPDLPWEIDNSVNNPLEELVSILIPQIDSVCKNTEIDKNNIGLIGHSWGGYAAAGIICLTNIFKASIAVAGIYDLGGSHGYIDEYGTFYCRRFLEGIYFGTSSNPCQATERYVKSSPYYLADKINTPLLIIHGDKDIACPVVEAEKLFAILERNNKKAELVIYKNEDHLPIDWKWNACFDMGNRVLNHFSQYLSD